MIATTGPYNAGIDSVYAKSKGIIVSGTGGAGNATLEHLWALILATVRYITVEDVNVKSGNAQWQSTMPLGLAGRTLGLVGVGWLGTSTAKVSSFSRIRQEVTDLTFGILQIAKAFNMKVIAWSPNLTPERAQVADVGYVETKAELFKQSDVYPHGSLGHHPSHDNL